ADGGDHDVVAGQLGAQPPGQADQGKLAGAVGKQVWDADLAADGRDVNDAALAATAHLGQGGEDGVKGGPEVDLHRLGEVVACHRLDGADADRPRVVDEHVDMAEVVLHSLNQPLGLPFVAQVADDGKRVRAQRLQLFPGPCHLVPVPSTNAQKRPVAGQLP